MSNHASSQPPSIVLASSSPYRKKLLARLTENFICHPPYIDERPQAGEGAAALAERLALEKAKKLVDTYHDSLIIGSDQVAALDQQILAKPGNFEIARKQLASCADREVVFYTGLCTIHAKSNHFQTVIEAYKVRFRPLSAQEIDNYLRREEPYDCAGAFKAEGLGIALFSQLTGRDPTSLIGLPLIALTDMLRHFGINPLLTQAIPNPTVRHPRGA